MLCSAVRSYLVGGGMAYSAVSVRWARHAERFNPLTLDTVDRLTNGTYAYACECIAMKLSSNQSA